MAGVFRRIERVTDVVVAQLHFAPHLGLCDVKPGDLKAGVHVHPEGEGVAHVCGEQAEAALDEVLGEHGFVVIGKVAGERALVCLLVGSVRDMDMLGDIGNADENTPSVLVFVDVNSIIEIASIRRVDSKPMDARSRRKCHRFSS